MTLKQRAQGTLILIFIYGLAEWLWSLAWRL